MAKNYGEISSSDRSRVSVTPSDTAAPASVINPNSRNTPGTPEVARIGPTMAGPAAATGLQSYAGAAPANADALAAAHKAFPAALPAAPCLLSWASWMDRSFAIGHPSSAIAPIP